MPDWNSQEPPWEAASDMLGGNVDWRTPGINPGASSDVEKDEGYIFYGGLFGNKGTKITSEQYEANKDKLNVKVANALGLVRKESDKREGGIEGFFTRGAFVILGTIFITIGLVMLSRPARDGIVEGIKEGLE